jgi:hypothetical protein
MGDALPPFFMSAILEELETRRSSDENREHGEIDEAAIEEYTIHEFRETVTFKVHALLFRLGKVDEAEPTMTDSFRRMMRERYIRSHA